MEQRVKFYQTKNFFLLENKEMVDILYWWETVTSKYAYQNVSIPSSKVFSVLNNIFSFL